MTGEIGLLVAASSETAFALIVDADTRRPARGARQALDIGDQFLAIMLDHTGTRVMLAGGARYEPHDRCPSPSTTSARVDVVPWSIATMRMVRSAPMPFIPQTRLASGSRRVEWMVLQGKSEYGAWSCLEKTLPDIWPPASIVKRPETTRSTRSWSIAEGPSSPHRRIGERAA